MSPAMSGDVEIVKATADAMGIELRYSESGEPATFGGSNILTRSGPWHEWNPLTNDAQMAALQKRFKLGSSYTLAGDWRAWVNHQPGTECYADTLNHAICLCVAQIAK